MYTALVPRGKHIYVYTCSFSSSLNMSILCVHVITSLHVHSFTKFNLMSISNHKSTCKQLQFLATCICKQLQFLVQYKATSRHNLLLATLQVNRKLGVKKRSDEVNIASAHDRVNNYCSGDDVSGSAGAL